MSDTSVRPLILEMSDPLARRLLESGRVDGPEPGARDRALLGLGLAPIGLLALVPAPAAAATATPASVLLAPSKALPWLFGKSLAIGLVSSMVALTAIEGVLPPTTQAPAGPALGPASSAATLPLHRPAAIAAPSTSPEPLVPTTALGDTTWSLPSNAAGKLPSPSLSSPTSPAAEASAPVAGASATPYAEARQMLDALARVRRSLPREAARALALLDDFEQRYPASPLAEEAVVLRIEALAALGRASEAHALASRFLREAPASIYRARVRALM